MADIKYYDVIKKPVITEKSMAPPSSVPMTNSQLAGLSL